MSNIVEVSFVKHGGFICSRQVSVLNSSAWSFHISQQSEFGPPVYLHGYSSGSQFLMYPWLADTTLPCSILHQWVVLFLVSISKRSPSFMPLARFLLRFCSSFVFSTWKFLSRSCTLTYILKCFRLYFIQDFHVFGAGIQSAMITRSLSVNLHWKRAGDVMWPQTSSI